MTTEIERAAVDREHLRLLAIFHYVVGGLHLVFATFCLLYLFLFLALGSQPGFFPPPPPAAGLHPAPPQFPAAIFHVMAFFFGGFVLLGWTVGGLTIYSGRCLARHRGKTFSYVVAAINCLSLPFGTILGIFTFVVLGRSSVERLYAEAPTPASAPTP